MNPTPPPKENVVDARKKFYEGLLLQELKTHMNTQREYKNDLIDNWPGDLEADYFAQLKEDEMRRKWKPPPLPTTKTSSATNVVPMTTEEQEEEEEEEEEEDEGVY